jgi:RimJ/RimL family protein N-acetyltransferase
MICLLLKTKRLLLHSFSKELLDILLNKHNSGYFDWMGDEEVNKYNSHGLFPQSKKELDNYFDRCENDKTLLCFAMIDEKTNNHIGMVSLQRIDFINRSAEFAIVIGDKDYWGQGYATEAIQKLFEHGFLKLGLNRIWSGTSVLNLGMIKSFQKLGMKQEGIYRQGQFLDGKFHDVAAYAILRSEWDWNQGKKLRINCNKYRFCERDDCEECENNTGKING